LLGTASLTSFFSPLTALMRPTALFLTLILALATPTVTLCHASPSPVSFSVGAFSFTRPPAWAWVISSSAMRKVQLAITSVQNNQPQTADVSFFFFGAGQGGSVQANVERWAKQFSSPDGSPVQAVTEVRTIHGVPVTFVSAHGSYSAGTMDGLSETKPDMALRGAILENESEGDLFIKMTGPEKLVKESTPTFDAMVEGACQQ